MFSGNDVAGTASFSATDRLAILNVLNSYGYFIDERPIENFFALFTDAATMESWQDGAKLVEGQRLRDVIASRKEQFKREGIQRRHMLIAPRFDRQGDDSASGQAYVQLYKIQNGEESLAAVGWYEFTVVKQHGQWKIDRWIAHADSRKD